MAAWEDLAVNDVRYATGNEQGEIPLHVGNPAVKELLQAWDVSQTDSLIAKFEVGKVQRARLTFRLR